MNDTVKKIQEKVDEAAAANAPARLEIEPMKFPTHTQGHITNTREIASRISDAFAIFRDFVGCKVYAYTGNQSLPQPVYADMRLGNFYADLYFELVKNNNGMPNLELINDPDRHNMSMLDRIRMVSNSGNASTYRVNKDTLDMISEFLPGYSPRGFNPHWESRIVEEYAYVNTYLQSNRKVNVRVMGLDVDAIMGLIYGIYDEADKDKDINDRAVKYDYHCIPIATSMQNYVNYYTPTTPQDQMFNQEYVIQVLRNDRSIISAMQKAIGINPNMNSQRYIPYIRNSNN
jgi:hypothetical protein